MTDEQTKRERWEVARITAALVVVLVLFVGLIVGPMVLADRFGAWAGVAGSIVAVPAWLIAGPRAAPGLLSGTLCVGGLFGLLVAAALSIFRAL